MGSGGFHWSRRTIPRGAGGSSGAGGFQLEEEDTSGSGAFQLEEEDSIGAV